MSCKNLISFQTKLLHRQRLLSDAQRNVRLYSRIKDRKSPIKGSRPSVPHGTNFYYSFGFIWDIWHYINQFWLVGRSVGQLINWCFYASAWLITDAIGQSGVQLFVDAGRPVDSALVTALVREVLAEKISAMFGERLELERAARQRTMVQATAQPDTVNTVLPKHTVRWTVVQSDIVSIVFLSFLIFFISLYCNAFDALTWLGGWKIIWPVKRELVFWWWLEFCMY